MENQDIDIDIAIAEILGWTQIKEEWLNWDGPNTRYFVGIPNNPECIERQIFEAIPNYCNDLNAMHVAEEVFCTWRFWDYADLLNRLVSGDMGKDSYIRATAKQRAEAFLRTIGKWVD